MSDTVLSPARILSNMLDSILTMGVNTFSQMIETLQSDGMPTDVYSFLSEFGSLLQAAGVSIMEETWNLAKQAALLLIIETVPLQVLFAVYQFLSRTASNPFHGNTDLYADPQNKSITHSEFSSPVNESGGWHHQVIVTPGVKQLMYHDQ